MDERDGQDGVNRRSFFGKMAGLGIGGALLAGRTGSAEAAVRIFSGLPMAPTKPTIDRLGVQLYTVMDQLRQDFDGTVEQVAKVGYKQVEFAGYGDRSPQQVRALLDRLKITAPSTHIGMDLLRNELPRQIEIAQIVGHKYITAPSLGRTESPLNTADAWKRVAEEFNQIGTKVKAGGMGLAFHSHTMEFVDLGGGKRGMDVFISETDPSLVSFELDLGWARVAGQNPVEWFQRYPGRFKMWHVKDFKNLKATAQARESMEQRGPRPGGPPTGAAAAPGVPPQGTPPAGMPVAGMPPAGRPTAAMPATGMPPTEGVRVVPGASSGAMAGPQPQNPVPIGAGEVNFKPIFAAWQKSGLEYFFVEQDAAGQYPGGSIASITTSYQAMRRLLA